MAAFCIYHQLRIIYSHLTSVADFQVCSQSLDLPDGVSVVTATAAAGHLSSSSIYPACFAPYLISTGCSDKRVRFWKCISQEDQSDGFKLEQYEWVTWDMMVKNHETSDIRLLGKLGLMI